METQGPGICLSGEPAHACRGSALPLPRAPAPSSAPVPLLQAMLTRVCPSPPQARELSEDTDRILFGLTAQSGLLAELLGCS